MTEGSDERNRLRHLYIGVPTDRVVTLYLGPANREGFHSRRFDQLENVVALVLTNDLTQDAAEVADVLTERLGQLSTLSCRWDEGWGTD